MAHTRVKFINGQERGESRDSFKGWHLLLNDGTNCGEYTACGVAEVDYETIHENVEKGGITCERCLKTIRFYKSLKL